MSTQKGDSRYAGRSSGKQKHVLEMTEAALRAFPQNHEHRGTAGPLWNKRGLITAMKQAVKKAPVVAPAETLETKRMHPFIKKMRRDWQLHLLILIPVVYKIIFSYLPMYGAQIAFRSYSVRGGIWGSDWVGLKWFVRFLGMPDFWNIVGNTFTLSFYSLCVSFPLPIFMALLLNVMRNQLFKKTMQTISYIPHFISTVVMVAILNQVFSPVSGLYGYFFRLFGGEGYPTDIRANPDAFPHMYVWSGIWQQLGWNTIIYLASLSSVSAELHEAAEIDGASRWKRVIHVDLPTILPTVGILLIMRCGNLLSIGFEKTFLMQNSLNLSKSEVISTYVYKKGLRGTGADQSYGSAVNLLENIINCIMLLSVNKLSKWVSHDEVALL